MSNPVPSISVAVDPTNPGQFFACCGLLELADRLWPGAEGWFFEGGGVFSIASKGTLKQLLKELSDAKLQSSLGDDGLRRLASLLSQAKTTLTPQDEAEKARLRAAWQVERVTLTAPFDISLDWWWDESPGMKAMKTWAAKQFVLEIARPMLAAIGEIKWGDEVPSHCLSEVTKLSGLPFYYDAANYAQNTPRDYGVAPAELKQLPSDRPLIELLTFIALQRFRPLRIPKSEHLRYSLWFVPLAPSVAGAAVSGALNLPSETRFGYRMLYRTEYMKAVLPSHPLLETE